MIPKKLLGIIDLSRAQTFCIYKVAKIAMVGKYRNFVLTAF